MKLNHQSVMHRTLATAVTVLVGAALFGASPLRAEPGAPGPDPGKGDGKKLEHREDRMEKRLEEMKTNLGLSDDQFAKIKTIREEQFASMKTIMEDKSLSPEEKKEKAKPLKDAADEKISAVLTDEQRTKWEEAKKARKEKGKDRPK